MGHSIAAKYASRPAARFVRASSLARERRLGLGGVTSFSTASARLTVLRGVEAGPYARLRAGFRGPKAARAIPADRRPRPAVRMQWSRSGRSGPNRRPSAAAAPWHA